MPLSTFAVQKATEHTLGLAPASWPPAAYWLQLHDGDPGAACTANVIAGPARQQITGWTWDGGDVRGESDNVIEFSSMPASTVTHASIFDASTSGNAIFYGALSASKTVPAGETLRFAADAVTFKHT